MVEVLVSAEKLTRLELENEALREMLEYAEDQIHGEWGSGLREPYNWLPELEQNICGKKTGHQPTYDLVSRWVYNGREYHRRYTRCELCDSWVSQEDLPL